MAVSAISEVESAAAAAGHHRLERLFARFTSTPLSPAVEARLLDLLLDGLGVGLAGRHTSVGAVADRLLGQGQSPWDQAMAQGMRMHALDFDDTHEPSLCHTGAAILPGLMALAAANSRSGADLLRAYDVGLRTVDFLAPYGPLVNEMGVHSTGLLGALGAAAACSWLVSGDHQVVAAAVEMAALMASGLGAAFGTDCKPVQAGRAAEVGVRATLLAAAGLSTPCDAVIGPRSLFSLWLHGTLPDLDWESDHAEAALNVAVKAYPACFLTHGVVDDFLELRATLDLTDPDAIREVRVTVHPIAKQLADKIELIAPNDGKFSLRYCALAALRDGEVGLPTFSQPATERLFEAAGGWPRWAGAFRVRTDRRLPVCAASVEVETGDGRTASAETRAQRGSLGRPMRRSDIVKKFLSNAGPVAEAEAEQVLGEVWSLPDATSVGGLSAIVRAAGVGAAGTTAE